MNTNPNTGNKAPKSQKPTAVPKEKKARAPKPTPNGSYLTPLDVKALKSADTISVTFDQRISETATLTLSKRTGGFASSKSDPWETDVEIEKHRTIILENSVIDNHGKVASKCAGTLLVIAPTLDLFAAQAIKGVRANKAMSVKTVLDASSAGHATFLVMAKPKGETRFLLGFPTVDVK